VVSSNRIRQLLRPAARRFVPLGVIAIVGVSVASVALASAVLTPRLVGKPTLGKPLFTSSGCGGCHTLKAAKAKGTVGPNLDGITLTEAQIITQITKGGSRFLTPAQRKIYKFPMTAYRGKLRPAQIQNLAAYVFTVRNPKAVPKTTTTTATTTTTTTPPTTTGGGSTTTTTPPTTTTKPSGDGCPAGVTIATSGNSDNDQDENGDTSDGDGCV
jgi:mono/diheme cytochrome c family protein